MSRLKELVRENETQLAAEQLAAFLKGANQDLYNEVLLHGSRLNRLRRQERAGLMTSAEAEVQRNRINHALLELIDAVPEQLQRSVASPRLTAGTFHVPRSVVLEQIFGSNHLKSIAWLHRGLEVARSVCRIVTPISRGTGFLVGHNRILTNHHVIPDRQIAKESWVEFNYEEDTQQRLQPSHRYLLKPSTLVADAGLDICLVEVEEGDSGVPPLASWGTLELDDSAQPKAGDHVTIIQHPQGGPKQIALTANQVVNVYEHRLQYSTDTLPGSSGSPVFNDAWKVIAIHHAGGELVSNSRGDRMFANEGILVSYLEPWLKR
ncbi:trypsin-like peptidase domain-containing protein [Archangium sp.]|uniref:trypsin-like peptidase domain-containing protein n=1 Tax=Archangium sp. TaxID=1872627 RepID=UPI00389983C0